MMMMMMMMMMIIIKMKNKCTKNQKNTKKNSLTNTENYNIL